MTVSMEEWWGMTMLVGNHANVCAMVCAMVCGWPQIPSLYYVRGACAADIGLFVEEYFGAWRGRELWVDAGKPKEVQGKEALG
jgi:hypothetical protein